VVTECREDESNSESSVSFYDAYDPFDYLDGSGTAGDPMYAAVVKDRTPTASSPPPLPPRNSTAWSTIERRKTSVEKKVHRNCFKPELLGQWTLYIVWNSAYSVGSLKRANPQSLDQ
jgi:hypothetical protein